MNDPQAEIEKLRKHLKELTELRREEIRAARAALPKKKPGRKKIMNKKDDYCESCDGMTKAGLVEHTFKRHGQQFHYKKIPAHVCRKCGEIYLDGESIREIERDINRRVSVAALSP
jgi:YgiT-type zinc finger domain-containing protein